MIYEDEDIQKDADSVTLLRILDVLYSVYLKLDEPAAQRLIDKHNEGGLIGPAVAFDADKTL